VIGDVFNEKPKWTYKTAVLGIKVAARRDWIFVLGSPEILAREALSSYGNL
jgi:hypothetical protein